MEANGLPTVVMGCAKDIVEQAGVPRFWFSNFPLGHSAGKPHDSTSQDQTLLGALSMFDQTKTAPTTITSPQRWAADDAWEADFMRIDHLDKAAIAKLRAVQEEARAAKRRITNG